MARKVSKWEFPAPGPKSQSYRYFSDIWGPVDSYVDTDQQSVKPSSGSSIFESWLPNLIPQSSPAAPESTQATNDKPGLPSPLYNTEKDCPDTLDELDRELQDEFIKNAVSGGQTGSGLNTPKHPQPDLTEAYRLLNINAAIARSGSSAAKSRADSDVSGITLVPTSHLVTGLDAPKSNKYLIREQIEDESFLPSSSPKPTGSRLSALSPSFEPTLKSADISPTNEHAQQLPVEEREVTDFRRLRARVLINCARIVRKMLRLPKVVSDIAKGVDSPLLPEYNLIPSDLDIYNAYAILPLARSFTTQMRHSPTTVGEGRDVEHFGLENETTSSFSLRDLSSTEYEHLEDEVEVIDLQWRQYCQEDDYSEASAIWEVWIEIKELFGKLDAIEKILKAMGPGNDPTLLIPNAVNDRITYYLNAISQMKTKGGVQGSLAPWLDRIYSEFQLYCCDVAWFAKDIGRQCDECVTEEVTLDTITGVTLSIESILDRIREFCETHSHVQKQFHICLDIARLHKKHGDLQCLHEQYVTSRRKGGIGEWIDAPILEALLKPHDPNFHWKTYTGTVKQEAHPSYTNYQVSANTSFVQYDIELEARKRVRIHRWSPPFNAPRNRATPFAQYPHGRLGPQKHGRNSVSPTNLEPLQGSIHPRPQTAALREPARNLDHKVAFGVPPSRPSGIESGPPGASNHFDAPLFAQVPFNLTHHLRAAAPTFRTQACGI